MKVLFYDGKYSVEMWDASTPEREAWALRQLFEELDESWLAYDEIKALEPSDGASAGDLAERELYDKAKAGDDKALRDLLTARKNWEYESWRFETVKVPDDSN